MKLRVTDSKVYVLAQKLSVLLPEPLGNAWIAHPLHGLEEGRFLFCFHPDSYLLHAFVPICPPQGFGYESGLLQSFLCGGGSLQVWRFGGDALERDLLAAGPDRLQREVLRLVEVRGCALEGVAHDLHSLRRRKDAALDQKADTNGIDLFRQEFGQGRSAHFMLGQLHADVVLHHGRPPPKT